MSETGEASREMTLDEWCERLPEIHRVRRELAALKTENAALVEKMATARTVARAAIRELRAELDIVRANFGDVQEERDALEAENAALREALRPFGGYPLEALDIGQDLRRTFLWRVDEADVLRARAALALAEAGKR